MHPPPQIGSPAPDFPEKKFNSRLVAPTYISVLLVLSFLPVSTHFSGTEFDAAPSFGSSWAFLTVARPVRPSYRGIFIICGVPDQADPR